MSGTVLSVICVRANGRDIPLTTFGSPFGAAVYHDAKRIATFLDLPLIERDRLVIESPDEHIVDTLNAGLSKATLDRIA